jgi:hypothetical protein
MLQELVDTSIDVAAGGGPLPDWGLLEPQCQLGWVARALQKWHVSGCGSWG